MALSRSERFKLKSGISDQFRNDPNQWDWDRQNLLLTEFGFPPLDNYGPPFAEQIATITESDLIEMYSIVTGIDAAMVEESVSDGDPGQWKPGYVRMFLSHSAVHKGFAGRIADELAVIGIHAFVAHDTMEYSKPWQEQIEQALRSMDVFVALNHSEFGGSPWCNQEVGWALGSRVPMYVIRVDGQDPSGFIGREQWPYASGSAVRETANVVGAWVASVPEVGDLMMEGLFQALQGANNYMDGGATAQRFAALSGLTAEQWDRLTSVYWSNDQLYKGTLASRSLRPFYEAHGRSWPPDNPHNS